MLTITINIGFVFGIPNVKQHNYVFIRNGLIRGYDYQKRNREEAHPAFHVII